MRSSFRGRVSCVAHIGSAMPVSGRSPVVTARPASPSTVMCLRRPWTPPRYGYRLDPSDSLDRASGGPEPAWVWNCDKFPARHLWDPMTQRVFSASAHGPERRGRRDRAWAAWASPGGSTPVSTAPPRLRHRCSFPRKTALKCAGQRAAPGRQCVRRNPTSSRVRRSFPRKTQHVCPSVKPSFHELSGLEGVRYLG